MRRRIGYGQGQPQGHYPVEPNSGHLATPNYGAVEEKHSIPTESEETLYNLILPVPFDWMPIIASPASGSTTVLIGDGNASPATVAGTRNSQRVPLGARMIIDGIFPYVEGNSGPVTQPRIPGNTVSITWSIFINGRSAGDYGMITQIIAPWNGMSERTLISLRAGEQLTCTVTNTDPNGIYPFIGIRLKGEMIPLRAFSTKLNADVRGGR